MPGAASVQAPGFMNVTNGGRWWAKPRLGPLEAKDKKTLGRFRATKTCPGQGTGGVDSGPRSGLQGHERITGTEVTPGSGTRLYPKGRSCDNFYSIKKAN